MADEMLPGSTRNQVIHQIANRMAQENPEEAIQWVMDMPQENPPDTIRNMSWHRPNKILNKLLPWRTR